MVKFELEGGIARIFNVMATVLLALLFYCSMRWSWKNGDLSDEFVYRETDSLILNILGLAVVLTVIFLLGRICFKYLEYINMDGLAAVVALCATGISIYWVFASNTEPQSDQQFICELADAFNRGDFSGLEAGGYVGMYRQQLGMITFLRIVFGLFGEYNFRAFQVIAACMIFLLVFAGYRIVGELTERNHRAEFYYLLIIVTCAPMYGYVPYVYGEICSTACAMLAGWMFLSCLRKFTWKKAFVLAAACGLAVQFRKNAVIIIIAMMIVVVVRICARGGKQHLRTGCAVVLGVLVFQMAVNGIYARVIPEDSKPMPAILHMAMGTNDDRGRPGWHNGYNVWTYMECDWEPEAASEAGRSVLKAFAQTCRENPEYAADFYWRKVNTQWNAPMYQGRAMNNKIAGEQSRIAHSVYFGRAGWCLVQWMNLYQSMIYGAVLYLLCVKRSKWRKIEKYTFLITVFGGFLFSIMWEAKTRYTFPYLLLMIPYAAVGIEDILRVAEDKIKAGITGRRKKENEE